MGQTARRGKITLALPIIAIASQPHALIAKLIAAIAEGTMDAGHVAETPTPRVARPAGTHAKNVFKIYIVLFSPFFLGGAMGPVHPPWGHVLVSFNLFGGCLENIHQAYSELCKGLLGPHLHFIGA